MVDARTADDESAEAPIGAEAMALDRRTTTIDRMVLPRESVRRLIAVALVYLGGLGAIWLFLDGADGTGSFRLFPFVVLLAFLLETVDSAAGMGFGTALAPLLFLLGYEPLQVVPVLLLSEMMTGIVAGFVHHELANVRFSLRSRNEATRLVALFAAVGSTAICASIVLVYLTFELPANVIKVYVGFLVVLMGALGLLRARLDARFAYRPRILLGFVLLAGINKGIGGGGYGPVITLGQIFSGVYEKSAAAITTLSEGLVSIVGAATFFLVTLYGVRVDLLLLPSVYAGGVFAAVFGPFLVRVVPNAILRHVIPAYAIAIGLTTVYYGLEI